MTQTVMTETIETTKRDRTGTNLNRLGLRLKTGLLALTGSALLASAGLAQDNPIAPAEAGAILDRFAADYMNDPTFSRDWEFGVVVDGNWWTVSLDHDTTSYTIRQGEPETPSFFYPAEGQTLAMVDRGEMAALTAMGKAFSSDYAPMDIDLMDGAGFDPAILGFTFHFFTRGTPEIIRWRDHATREVHGGNLGIIYYQPGLRSGFGYVMPGQHVNEDERSRTNPFPSMVIFTGERAIARLNGVDQEVGDGDIIFIPAGMSHEFLNPFDEPAEFLLFMFGEGA
ncbi:cupin domain-containing protein [Maricaulis parjimensis]|uniref:cupin domain-containing protein n=1 Tax=Maricaulis parjimensis TaxID=144023 RepID=UPI001939BE62|nr:cupin domain-containing protein [Maricaulis parjimensis]